MLQRGNSGDGCDLASTLCTYDLFVLSWAWVRRVRREYLFRAANMWWMRAQYVVSVCLFLRLCGGLWECLFVATVVKDVLVLEYKSMLYVWVRGVMDVVFSVCIVTSGDVGARVWEVSVFRHADVVCLSLVCIL